MSRRRRRIAVIQRYGFLAMRGGHWLCAKRGVRMKYREAKTGRARKSYGGDGRAIASIAIAGAAMLAVALCGGCLYTAVPALAGPSTTYPQGTGSQPAQTAEPSQTTNDP